ncbi:hypothetical protein D1832_10635 [Dermacoccus abyssi]|uniref:Uncharacterized protein n=1 Tax=Dermacoccus abyssi TaxID=322596 RepID=A0A417Z2P6_9MICO|nr:hypothetical protein D1832_10635 [Dermacoccus abyssi]
MRVDLGHDVGDVGAGGVRAAGETNAGRGYGLARATRRHGTGRKGCLGRRGGRGRRRRGRRRLGRRWSGCPGLRLRPGRRCVGGSRGRRRLSDGWPAARSPGDEPRRGEREAGEHDDERRRQPVGSA